jgi:hypothetical protein
MTHHPLNRYTAVPWKGGDVLGCGVVLAGRTADFLMPVSHAAAHVQPSGAQV